MSCQFSNYSKVREISEAGGEALPVQVDVRNFDEIQNMVEQTVKKYRRLDVLVCKEALRCLTS